HARRPRARHTFARRARPPTCRAGTHRGSGTTRTSCARARVRTTGATGGRSLMTLYEQPEAGRITRLLHDVRDGDGQAFGALLPLVYAALKRIADRPLRRERQGHTLHATALVHE